MPIGANGGPASATYVRNADGGYMLHTLQVFTIGGGRIAHLVAHQFEEVSRLFDLPPRFH
ncbi:hypothetical protein ACIHDR_14530 [Nocardia sp. NPDC052278]|uniref:hypothetical protein n=1 Tax=unclassified Nocardia TaxID=2637762 RepID=UPI00369A147D